MHPLDQAIQFAELIQESLLHIEVMPLPVETYLDDVRLGAVSTLELINAQLAFRHCLYRVHRLASRHTIPLACSLLSSKWKYTNPAYGCHVAVNTLSWS